MATYQSRFTGAEIDAGIDAANAALPKSGGTMIGALLLAGDPTDEKGAVTKKYVDDAVQNIASTPGADGEDGVSPTITVTEITGGHRITITDANGMQPFEVMDGEDGADGVSPYVAVETISGGHRVSITDAEGTKSFNVMDGEDGADGSGGDGSGDMLKSIYDADNDGVVDDAAMLGGKTPDHYYSADNPPTYPVASVNGQTGDVVISETDPTVPDWAKAETKPTYTANEVGLGNVDNVKQYSESNPPPYPVTSVNGKTGDVIYGKRTLLWENPDSSAEMEKDTIIDLASDDYDELIVYFRESTSRTRIMSVATLKGYSTQMISMGFPSAGIYVGYRMFSYVSDTQYKAGGGYCFQGVAGSDKYVALMDVTEYNIPVAVYGIKY